MINHHSFRLCLAPDEWQTFILTNDGYMSSPLYMAMLFLSMIEQSLTRLPLDKMATISQTFSNAFSCMKSFVF